MWQSLIARLRQEATSILGRSRDGRIITTLTIIINASGEPEAWWVNSSSRIEPARSAEQIVKILLGKGTD